jgi:hypothetical protein
MLLLLLTAPWCGLSIICAPHHRLWLLLSRRERRPHVRLHTRSASRLVLPLLLLHCKLQLASVCQFWPT